MKKIEPLIKWGHFIAQAPYHTACLAQEVERLQKAVNELIEGTAAEERPEEKERKK